MAAAHSAADSGKQLLSLVESGEGWSASGQPPSLTAASVGGGESLSERAAKEAGIEAWNGKSISCGPLRAAPPPGTPLAPVAGSFCCP